MSARSWLLLIHQIPARPIYLRARIRARLGRTGAVALKNSVYAVPDRESARARLAEISDEIRRGGGEVFVCEARFAPADEEKLIEASRQLRRREYEELTAAAEALLGAAGGRARGVPAGTRARIPGLRRQLESIAAADPFGAPGRREAVATLQRLERRVALAARRPAEADALSPWQGRTWVTRAGVHVDRIACAWFIRRFLDPGARIRFLGAGRAEPRPGELGFDMPGALFSHEEGRCSLETLLHRTGIEDPALRRIAGIVHDLDLKDSRHRHPETAGIEQLLSGMLAAHVDDHDRLERGATLFDDLYRSFRRRPVITFPRSADRRPE